MRLLACNTVGPYKLVTVIDQLGAYEAYNLAASRATADTLVFLNDDMFVAPGWDVAFRASLETKCIVTGYLVEPGRLPVNARNLQQNFGTDPHSFDEQAFYAFAQHYGNSVPEEKVGFGWYMPYAVRRTDFVPYPTRAGIPNDSLLFGLFAARGYRFKQVRSFAYHLQRMSEW